MRDAPVYIEVYIAVVFTQRIRYLICRNLNHMAVNQIVIFALKGMYR